jgi:uncharacterized protein
VRCLEQLKAGGSSPQGDAGNPRGLAADLGHLGAIAASAAVRAGIPSTVSVPVMDAAVHLPTLGRLAMGPAAAGAPADSAEPGMAAVTIDGETVRILVTGCDWVLGRSAVVSGESFPAPVSGHGRTADWQPVRTMRAAGICVTLEDTDPYRDCHQWAATSRLSEPEFAQWRQSFQDAWQEIEVVHPAYAPALAAGLRVLMPLRPGPEGREVSASARHAFGAVGAALPDDPVTLALLLIHEFQHVKLGAILDLFDLFDPADDRLFPAPWREDPRPLEGLLQGTYAHLAVSDFWRARREAEASDAAEAAGQRFEYWHARTCGAIETLAGSGSLTPLGVRFVDEMRHSVQLG